MRWLCKTSHRYSCKFTFGIHQLSSLEMMNRILDISCKHFIIHAGPVCSRNKYAQQPAEQSYNNAILIHIAITFVEFVELCECQTSVCTHRKRCLPLHTFANAVHVADRLQVIRSVYDAISALPIPNYVWIECVRWGMNKTWRLQCFLKMYTFLISNEGRKNLHICWQSEVQEVWWLLYVVIDNDYM